MKPIALKFGGYQEPASIHNRAAGSFGELLTRKLGDRISFELIGSVLKIGRPSGDLAVMVESGRSISATCLPCASRSGCPSSSC